MLYVVIASIFIHYKYTLSLRILSSPGHRHDWFPSLPVKSRNRLARDLVDNLAARVLLDTLAARDPLDTLAAGDLLDTLAARDLLDTLAARDLLDTFAAMTYWIFLPLMTCFMSFIDSTGHKVAAVTVGFSRLSNVEF